MEHIINRIIAGGLEELKGLELSGQLPLKDELLNEFVQEGLSAVARPATTAVNSDTERPDISKVLKHVNLKVATKEGALVLNFSLKVT